MTYTCAGLNLDSQSQVPLDLPDHVPPLRMLYLYLSAGCNLHCRHCWITPTFVRGKPVPGECIDFELLKGAVAEARTLGLIAAKLTGGEPVLHPEFIRILDWLTEQGLRLTMETNGTLIDRALADHLHNHTGLYHIAVSFDSSEAGQHDWFRGVNGAFEAAQRGFRNLVEAGFHPQIIMSVYRDNVSRIESLIEFAMELGSDSVKFNPIVPTGRGAEMHRKGLALAFDELIELNHRIRGPLQDQYPIHLCSMVPPALLSVKEMLRGASVGCCSVRNILGILGSGEMALCGIGRTVPELCFGRLGHDSLRSVWIQNPVLNQMRQDLDRPFPGICGDCIHAPRCLTHCLAMNYEESGKLVFPSSMCITADQRGLFPSTRRKSWDAAQSD